MRHKLILLSNRTSGNYSIVLFIEPIWVSVELRRWTVELRRIICINKMQKKWLYDTAYSNFTNVPLPRPLSMLRACHIIWKCCLCGINCWWEAYWYPDTYETGCWRYATDIRFGATIWFFDCFFSVVFSNFGVLALRPQ